METTVPNSKRTGIRRENFKGTSPQVGRIYLSRGDDVKPRLSEKHGTAFPTIASEQTIAQRIRHEYSVAQFL
jgi:hypothetical protein